jgi:uncharacterized protein
MDCRACGTCCTAISISSIIPGFGPKPAGVRCPHLRADNLCDLFGKSERPAVCSSFQASVDICGNSADEALVLITNLERLTAP